MTNRKNPLFRTDSYKISHANMYPGKMEKMYDYIECRANSRWNKTVFFGLRMFIDDYLKHPFTQKDIWQAEDFYRKHFPFSANVFKKDMFQYILDNHNGYFPVKIKAVPEGSVVPVGNVMCTIECTDPNCPTVVSFLETIMLRYIWYGSTVATNSRVQKKSLKHYGELTSDCTEEWIDYALHDFGARGVSSGESAICGGMGHLINFKGSDTVEAITSVPDYYKIDGVAGVSVPASEHSVMSCMGRDNEFAMVDRIIDIYGKYNSVVSIVNDTYDMEAHLDYLCGKAAEIKAIGMRVVTRPDSGDARETIVTCLNKLWVGFGGFVNSKGYKVLDEACRVIQGDNVSADTLDTYLHAIMQAGFSTENVIFGSGGGLLQKVSRDTQSFAMKESWNQIDGVGYDVYKIPVTQPDKVSKAGRLKLIDIKGKLITTSKISFGEDLLQEVDIHSIAKEQWEVIRQRAAI